MVDVLSEITINRSSKAVYDYAASPDHAPDWYENIHFAEWLTPKSLTIGSQVAFKAKFLGRDLAYVYEIVELIPEKKLIMKTADGPFPMETTYTWEALENHTRMTLRNRGIPTGFSKVLSPVMSTMMKRANKKDLKKLKAILERY